mgnify:CR=1 FL=1
MKRFICSLCHKGILGGMLYLDKESVVYRTNKLTVNEKYRNLVLPRKDIAKITWKWIIATFRLKDGEAYKIMIFNKGRFQKCYEEYCGNE